MTSKQREPLPDSEAAGGVLMAELFASVGIDVCDEEAYNSLVEYVDGNGARTRADRGEASLHGRCWKIGNGLEIWSVLYERGATVYYADCRPAFRSRYLRTILPWELIEYDEDGEAIVRGCIEEGREIVFELQNLTEIHPRVFRQSHLHVALAGLAYTAYITPYPPSVPQNNYPRQFELAETFEEFADDACENDYLVSGHVLAWREVQNPATASQLVWIYVDTGGLSLEILVNRRALRGPLAVGAAISANVWLQGHVLALDDIMARYEGVDREYEASDFWSALRRDN